MNEKRKPRSSRQAGQRNRRMKRNENGADELGKEVKLLSQLKTFPTVSRFLWRSVSWTEM